MDTKVWHMTDENRWQTMRRVGPDEGQSCPHHSEVDQMKKKPVPCFILKSDRINDVAGHKQDYRQN